MKAFLKILFFICITCILASQAQGQLCQGSLGDPIINITFGAGTNPGAPLSAATTSYQYVSSDCPVDGFYTVRNNTANCFGSNWFTLTSDHTGNSNGYFMLVNASYQPSAFYLDTVKGLCGGTTYEFAAWIINVINASKAPGSIEPNLTFSIEKTDGTILQSYNTNNIPSPASPTWKQYGFFFTTPPAVSNVVLRIFNNAPGGNGNDLGLDDITFRPCGPQLTPSISGLSSNTDSLCEGIAKSYTFTCSVSAGFNNPAFQWQENIGGVWTDIPGAITTTLVKNIASTTPAGTYAYRLTVAEAGNFGSPQCRIASSVLTIIVNKNPVTTALNSGPVCSGNLLQLTATGGTQYSWTGVNGFTASTDIASINDVQTVNSGKYYVLVKSAEGCTHRDSTTVIVNPSPVAQVSFTNATICQGDSIQLHASGGTVYEWKPITRLSSPFSTDPYASPNETTDYMVIAGNQFMCKDSALVTVVVKSKPTADAGPDKTIIANSFIQLAANATGDDLTYEWVNASYIDDPQLLRPMVNPPVDTRYILNVISGNGCGTAADTMEVFVYKGLYIPNAFSPNGDHINDTWNIPALGAYGNFELIVYNRYGQIVFRTTTIGKGWDGKFKGKDVPIGAYTYLLNIKINGSRQKISGTVLVIR